MKHKKLFRSVTALLAALVLMGGFSVTAFAGGGDVSDEPRNRNRAGRNDGRL